MGCTFFYSLAVFVQIIKYGKPFLIPTVYSTIALTQSCIHFMSVRIISYTTDEQLLEHDPKEFIHSYLSTHTCAHTHTHTLHTYAHYTHTRTHAHTPHTHTHARTLHTHTCAHTPHAHKRTLHTHTNSLHNYIIVSCCYISQK